MKKFLLVRSGVFVSIDAIVRVELNQFGPDPQGKPGKVEASIFLDGVEDAVSTMEPEVINWLEKYLQENTEVAS